MHEAGDKWAEPADFFPGLMRSDGRLVRVVESAAARSASDGETDVPVAIPRTIEEIDMGPDYDPMALLAKVARINAALGGRDLRTSSVQAGA